MARRKQQERERDPVADPAVPAGPVSDFEEVDDAEVSALMGDTSADEKLREWAARSNPENLTIKTYVYKYDNAFSGDHKMLCDRIDDDIPDPHQIGLAYGSGRYMMIVDIPRGAAQKKDVKALRFRLHSRYDDLKKQNTGVNLVSPVAVAAPVVNNSMSEGIAMFRAVVEVLRPLLEVRQVAASSGPDVGKILEGQYDMVQSMMKKSLMSGQELIDQVHRAKLENAPADPADDEPDFLTKAMPLIQQFLPLVLNGGGAGAATAAAIRAVPEVRAVIGDRAALSRVVSWLDRSQGKEKSDRILAALKVKRPAVNGKPAPVRVAPVKMAVGAR